MIRSLLVRGMLVGAVAGTLAFVFALLFGEPQVDKAVAFEEQLARLANEPVEPEVVSRGVQSTLGLFTGTFVMGVALGGIFGLVFAYAYGRIGAIGPRVTAAVLALAAFLTITLVPFTKYPANPPTVGNPDTIDRRTLLFFTMIAISILAAVAAARVRRATLPRLGAWGASTLAVGAFLTLIVIAELILPAVHETPKGFPADVLYDFRIASLGISATLWTTIGLGFGALAERVLASAQSPRSVVPTGLQPD